MMTAISLQPRGRALSATARFALAALLLAIAYLTLVRPQMVGDVDEYLPMTIAWAEHGTPDIRVRDLETATSLLPQHAASLREAIDGVRQGRSTASPGLLRGHDGRYYAIHFAAYPALAALPFLALRATGLPEIKCFQVVNVVFVVMLGFALLRWLGSAGRACAGLALLLGCGGLAYLAWSSPEAMTAAAVLAALALLLTNAPIRAGLLAGLAATQNPPVASFFAIAPVLVVAAQAGGTAGWRDVMRRCWTTRLWTGLALGACAFATSVLFNLVEFRTPSIIAQLAVDPELVGWARLQSFLFDLNQGMIIGIPGVAAGLAFWGWRLPGGVRRVSPWLVVTAFTLALVMPALGAKNWNSGAAGMMRYAFWGAMPLLFLLLFLVRGAARVPLPMIVCVAVLQVLATVSMASYTNVQFSPLARLALRVAPRLYNPDPEVFAERVSEADGVMDRTQVYSFPAPARASKTLYHIGNLSVGLQLCGPGGVLSIANKQTAVAQGWMYIDGPVRCDRASGPPPPAPVEYEAPVKYDVRSFNRDPGPRLMAGWSGPELRGGMWDGVWSDGTRSLLLVRPVPGRRISVVVLTGFYFEGNHRTRVRVNGRDYGWLDLGSSPPLRLDAGSDGPVTIELEHEAAHAPGADDQRLLAFFLQAVSVR